jgi:DNA-binding MarR family transcriptional regulator
MLTARRLPEKTFADAPAHDPAWDILLDLYIASIEKRVSDISSLCAASPGSITTALRRIHSLEEHGLIKRVPDAKDKRRFHLVLLAGGQRDLEGCLSGMLRVLEG